MALRHAPAAEPTQDADRPGGVAQTHAGHRVPRRPPTTALWQPTLGAWPERGTWRFRVWAPSATRVELVLEHGAVRELIAEPHGYFSATWDDLRAGDTYRYRLDGRGPFPDPASRYQPRGVHGPSQLVHPHDHAWRDLRWTSVALEDAVIYELHVGAFSSAGTFDGAASRLQALRDLGITVIELMPVAAFAGTRNWGYDGAALFAPAAAYGPPAALRRFVDAAHGLGMAVMLDVVYNHFGPDGWYQAAFASQCAAPTDGPWGLVPNLREPGHEHVRAFFIENALHWLHEYHMDGLRFDATHAFVDDGAPPFLDELVEAVRARAARPVLLMAEDDRNERRLIEPKSQGGVGLDAVWADDYHHQVRVAVAGDRDGYYASYDGSTAAIADTVSHGWFYRGAHSVHHRRARGTSTEGLPPSRFVVCLQNHDQVGNRAVGDRLHHTIGLDVWRALSVMLLMLPETPLLFMGQEWAASTPFLYFTDHSGELGRSVDAGRRAEFAAFATFAVDAAVSIPAPQDLDTFLRSRLAWAERDREPHASVRRLYRRAIALRRQLAPSRRSRGGVVARPLDPDTLIIDGRGRGARYLCVVRLRGAGRTTVDPVLAQTCWRTVLTTEDPRDVSDAAPLDVDLAAATSPAIVFSRPGAVVLIGDEVGAFAEPLGEST